MVGVPVDAPLVAAIVPPVRMFASAEFKFDGNHINTFSNP
jgi:hypothetical protein